MLLSTTTAAVLRRQPSIRARFEAVAPGAEAEALVAELLNTAPAYGEMVRGIARREGIALPVAAPVAAPVRTTTAPVQMTEADLRAFYAGLQSEIDDVQNTRNARARMGVDFSE